MLLSRPTWPSLERLDDLGAIHLSVPLGRNDAALTEITISSCAC